MNKELLIYIYIYIHHTSSMCNEEFLSLSAEWLKIKGLQDLSKMICKHIG